MNQSPLFRPLLLTVILMNSLIGFSQTQKTTAYMLPGVGSDYRLFSKFELDSNYTMVDIQYDLPEPGSTMSDYAHQLAIQIDTSTPFILIGTSLGGMLSVEMADFLAPEKIIIIASAKLRTELPPRYRFQKLVPIHKIVPSQWVKTGTFVLQPLVEPDRNHEKDLFLSMLNDKDPEFMSRAVQMIVEWERTSYSVNVIHIHGENDKTLPIRNINCQYVIPGGSHVMTLTRSEEICQLINRLL